jgi:hypothetical protein
MRAWNIRAEQRAERFLERARSCLQTAQRCDTRALRGPHLREATEWLLRAGEEIRQLGPLADGPEAGALLH